jgi:hypothetical protein
MGRKLPPDIEGREENPMDERTTVSWPRGRDAYYETARRASLAWKLCDAMDMEAELFKRLGAGMDRLRDSFAAKRWTESLTIAQGFESAALEIEATDRVRETAFSDLKAGFGVPDGEQFSAVVARVPAEERSGLEESWRGLKTSVFRLKTATGRLRYSTETLSDTLNRIFEGIFPHRRGRIYTRHGTPVTAAGSLIIDKEL